MCGLSERSNGMSIGEGESLDGDDRRGFTPFALGWSPSLSNWKLCVLSIQREDAYLIKVSGPRRRDQIAFGPS